MSLAMSPFYDPNRSRRDGILSQQAYQRANDCGRTVALSSLAQALGTHSVIAIRFCRLYLSECAHVHTSSTELARTGSIENPHNVSILHGAVLFDVMQLARNLGASYHCATRGMETELARLQGCVEGGNVGCDIGSRRVLSSQLRHLARQQHSQTSPVLSGPHRRRKSRQQHENNFRRNGDSVASLAVSPLAAILLAYVLMHHLHSERVVSIKSPLDAKILANELENLLQQLILWRSDAMGDNGDLSTGRAYREIPLTQEIVRVERAIAALRAHPAQDRDIRIAVTIAAIAGWQVPDNPPPCPLHATNGVVELARLPQHVPAPPANWLIAIRPSGHDGQDHLSTGHAPWPSAQSLWSSTLSQASSSSASSAYSNESVRSSVSEATSPSLPFALDRFVQLAVTHPLSFT